MSNCSEDGSVWFTSFNKKFSYPSAWNACQVFWMGHRKQDAVE